MLLRVALASALAAPLALAQSVEAQDAPFGCKVLLCAAATTPSWSGIPYCVPVMHQLFSQLAKGDPWPSCSEANASPIGYQPYADCPAGETPIGVTETNGSGRGGTDTTTAYIANVNGGFCGEPTKTLMGNAGGCVGAYIGGVESVINERTDATIETGGQCYALSNRPLNPTPYYVDITTANGVTRFSFSLAGYGG
jgi:hypothetical protein